MAQETKIPTVSVMISTHNRLHYLKEAVDSVLNQTFTDFELIVCDDASRDETPAYIRALCEKDARVRSVRHDINIGMSANWNSGVRAARGVYWTKLDDDNRFLPTILETLVGELERYPEAAFAFTDEWFINGAGVREVELTDALSARYKRSALSAGAHREDTPLLAAQQSCGINATVFRRTVMVQMNGFNEAVGSFADIDLYLKIAAAGMCGVYVPDRLSEYRIHDESFTAVTPKNLEKARQGVMIRQSFQFAGVAEEVRQNQLVRCSPRWREMRCSAAMSPRHEPL